MQHGREVIKYQRNIAIKFCKVLNQMSPLFSLPKTSQLLPKEEKTNNRSTAKLKHAFAANNKNTPIAPKPVKTRQAIPLIKYSATNARLLPHL